MLIEKSDKHITLTTKSTKAVVQFYGANLSSLAYNSIPILFCSKHAQFNPNNTKDDFGGIPIVFPQFALTINPALPHHGFANKCEWKLTKETNSTFTFTLTNTGQNSHWPFPFIAELAITINDGEINQSLCIRNTGDCGFEITPLLHTYIAVDVTKVVINGLDGVEFVDKNKCYGLYKQSGELRIQNSIDRIYKNVQSECVVVRDGIRKVRIEKNGFSDVVVWNPYGQCYDGLGEGEWKEFVCVEVGNVKQPISLLPGQEWKGSQTLNFNTI